MPIGRIRSALCLVCAVVVGAVSQDNPPKVVTGGPLGSLTEQLKQRHVEPVSYTHLDVYKRQVYEEEERGQPPYHPRMMTKILIYGYCVGVFSSRRIQKKLSLIHI